MADPNQTQMLPDDPHRTVMGTAPTINATQTIKPVQCPVCKTRNPAGMMFCVECGLIFDRALPDDVFGAPVVRLPVLVEETGREHPVRIGVNVVGREGDIMLPDPKVSRRHAQIVYDDGTMTLEDLGSTNGTEINGEKIPQGDKKTLNAGDSVSFGGVTLKLSTPGQIGKTQMLGGGPSVDTGTKGQGDEGSPAVEKEEFEAAAFLIVDGEEKPLKKGVNTFGRKAENDVQITDPYVSGKHGKIEVEVDGIYLTDIGSTNGTLLNGEKLEANDRKPITADDEIKIGGLTLKIRRVES